MSTTNELIICCKDTFNASSTVDNVTSDVSSGLLETFPKGPLLVGVIVGIVITIVGILGNSVTIVALLRSKQIYKNATTKFIINLCIVDCMFCVIGPPLTAVTFVNTKWILPDYLCSVQGFVQFLNATVSMFTMTAIAVNRYVLIAHPRWYRRMYTSRTIAVKIACLWILALCLWLPSLAEIWGRFGFDEKSGRCTLLHSKGQRITVFPFVAATLFIQGILIMFCYMRIFCIVKRSKKNASGVNMAGYDENIKRKRARKSSRSMFKRSISQSSSADTGKPRESSVDQRDADMRILRISFFIICVFFLSFVPIVIVRIGNLQKKAPMFYIFAYLSLSLSACVNPVIYFFMSKEYRNAYKALFATTATPADENGKLQRETKDASSSNTGSSSV